MDLYFDKAGRPISEEEYRCLRSDRRYRTVARDELPDGGLLSTVWLGTDHGIDDNRPLIFETMAFPADSRVEDICEHYSTLEEALAGHARLLAKLQKAVQ